MKKHYLILILSLLATVFAPSARGELAGDPDDPDFVHATLLVAGPGQAMYQVTGHTMIRMECPAAGLDNIFSFENDGRGTLGALFTQVNGRFLVADAKTYLQQFSDEGREVVAFPLNLSPRHKQRLWQVLDSLTTTGEHPFNIRQESCSGYILGAIDTAIVPAKIAVIDGNAVGKTNAEALDSASLAEGPWRNMLIHICVGEDNNIADNLYNQAAPTNIYNDRNHFYIVEEGRMAQPLFADTIGELTPPRTGFFTPVAVAVGCLLLGVLCLVLGFLGRGRGFVGAVRWTVAALVAIAGILLAVLLSTPSAIGGWANWNFVLLNPVPLVLLIYTVRSGRDTGARSQGGADTSRSRRGAVSDGKQRGVDGVGGACARWWRVLVGCWAVYALVLPMLTASIVPAMSIFALAAALIFLPLCRYK
ncbi:MAG: DUF4105 domain-containing protein [Muribaculaceae bacterium]|nr:DUF4105 domain-containing protein [Muribaculaceae bacterium]